MRFPLLGATMVVAAIIFANQAASAGAGKEAGHKPRASVSATAKASNFAGSEKPTIFWHFDHNPPVFIRRGPDAGTGVGDRILGYVESRMPEYRHVEVEAVLNRSMQELTSREDVCIAGIFKTEERQQVMVFTDPLFRLSPNRLIILRKNADVVHRLLDETGAVDLAAFVRASGLVPGVVKDRAYSPAINALIDNVSNEMTVVRLPYPGFAKLMLHGRFDYTFGFPLEAEYQFAMLNRGEDYLSFPIQGEAKVMNGYFGCGDTPFGHQVVARVNAIAKDERAVQVFEQIFSPWGGVYGQAGSQGGLR